MTERKLPWITGLMSLCALGTFRVILYIMKLCSYFSVYNHVKGGNPLSAAHSMGGLVVTEDI